jgi:predicted nucleic acid-binding protein
MGFPTSSIDSITRLVVDTSTIINLNATGCAERILQALPAKVIVVDVILGELDEGRPRGRPDADMLRELVASGIIEIVALGNESEEHFEKLVVGPAVSTLDDGEAATIAYAAANGEIAVIDERKAVRICAEMYPRLRICNTVDLLALPEVSRILGEDALIQAVFQALMRGRMSVLPRDVEWVVGLIGSDKAAACTSLPGCARCHDASLNISNPQRK